MKKGKSKSPFTSCLTFTTKTKDIYTLICNQFQWSAGLKMCHNLVLFTVCVIYKYAGELLLFVSSWALYLVKPLRRTFSPSSWRNSSRAGPATSLLYISSSVLCPARQYITPTFTWKLSWEQAKTQTWQSIYFFNLLQQWAGWIKEFIFSYYKHTLQHFKLSILWKIVYFPPTPCSSSFISCSVTLGVLRASLRQERSSSGRRYSSTSLMGRPRLVPCLEVEGTASSSIEPRRVISWKRRDEEQEITVRSARTKGMHLRNF